MYTYSEKQQPLAGSGRCLPQRRPAAKRHVASRKFFCSASLHLSRRGALMVEMVVCTVLLSLVATILVPAVHAIQRQRKITRSETLTLIELNNQASLLQMSASTPAADVKLSAWFLQRYPGASLQISELPDAASSEGGANPLRIVIAHPAGDAGVEFNRSLTVWVALPEEET